MPIILNGTTGITTPGITNTGPFTFQGVVELPAGTVGAPSLTTTGDTNTGIYFPGADQIAITTAGTQRFVVDAIGNIGVGVTPSAWSGFRALQVGGATSIWSSTSGGGSSFYSNNVYYNGSNRIRINAGYATEYIQDSSGGAHIWFNAASSTAGSTISFTQAMTLNASGQLLLGTTSAGTTDAPLIVSNGGAAGMEFSPTAISGENRLLSYNRSTSAYAGFTLSAADIKFQTGGTERARLDSSGNLGLGVTPDGNNLAKTFELQQGFTMFGFSNTSYLSANAYYNSGWKYKSTAAAAYYEMSGANGHQWSVANSGTAGNAITFTTALTLNANGNLVLRGGNTAANGVGVTFPATQSASSNANTLDDYEEGTWTPDLRDGGNSRSPSYSFISGTYTKIGNLVCCRWGFSLSNKGAGSGSGEIQIYGLPFTSAVTGAYQEPNVSVSTGNLNTASNAPAARMVVANSGAWLFGRIINNSDTIWTYNDLTNNSWIIGEIYYMV